MVCYSWPWRPGGPVFRSDLKTAGVRVAEDCTYGVRWLCAASRNSTSSSCYSHSDFSGWLAPASTFLLLSNSGTAWDQWFLLLRFLSVLAVNPGPPGDQRALGHHPLQLDTHQRCPCPRMGEQRRLVQCQLCPHPSHAWAGGAGPFSSHSVPPQTRSSPCSLGGTQVAPRLVTGSRQDLRCSHVSRWFPCAYRRG